jgi:class 3 adenylate cyclase
MVRMNGELSRITVSETRTKEVKVYRTRDIAVIDKKAVRRASDEVTVPRISNDESRKILERYQKRMDKPIVTETSSVTEVADTASIDDINKFSDAAESVDEGDIPVVSAGRVEAMP